MTLTLSDTTLSSPTPARTRVAALVVTGDGDDGVNAALDALAEALANGQLGGAAADALEKATIQGQEYLSIEELQQASGVSNAILDRLRQVGALGDLPESSQVSFF